MGQEIRKKKVRIALLVALWLAVLALAGGLVLVKLADVQRRDQLALMGRLAVLYEGSETDFLEAVMQEPTDEDYAAPRVPGFYGLAGAEQLLTPRLSRTWPDEFL